MFLYTFLCFYTYFYVFLYVFMCLDVYFYVYLYMCYCILRVCVGICLILSVVLHCIRVCFEVRLPLVWHVGFFVKKFCIYRL